MRLELLILSGLAASAAAAPILGSNYGGWALCGNEDWLTPGSGTVLAQEAAKLRSTGRRLQEAITEGTDLNSVTPSYKQRHQIISVNLTSGKMSINHKALLWDLLENTNDEVQIVAVYGHRDHGKSTLASMLTCGLSEPHNFAGSMLFEAKSDDGELETEGVWASDPIKYDGRTYVVVEIQATEFPKPWEGMSAKQVNDITTKMVALFSETASQFINVNTRAANELALPDYNALTKAFRTFRDDLIRIADPDQVPVEDNELNIHSINFPSMLMVPRGGVGAVVDENAGTSVLEFSKSARENQRVRSVVDTNEDLKGMLSQNFKAHNVPVQGLGEHQDLRILMFPVIDIAAWDREDPFPFKAGSHCSIYRDMAEDGKGRCKKANGEPGDHVTYRMMIEAIIAQFHKEADNRKVAFGADAGQEQAAPLTGRRMKGLLEASVTEINRAGPLPDTELWRVVMQDRCGNDLSDWTDRTRGRKRLDTTDGTLKRIDEEYNFLFATIGDKTEAQLGQASASLNAQWLTSSMSWEEDVNTWFDDHPLMRTVRKKCFEQGKERLQFLNASANTLLAQVENLITQKRAEVLEVEVDQLKKVQKQLEEDLLLAQTQNLLYQWGIYIVAGIIVLIALSQMCGGVGNVCAACSFCTKDLATKDHEQKVIIIDNSSPQGTELGAPAQAAPLSTGVRAPGGKGGGKGEGNMTAGHSQKSQLERTLLQERIEDLEDHILDLASHLTPEEKKRLQLSQA